MVQGKCFGSFHLVAPVPTNLCGTFLSFMYFWIAVFGSVPRLWQISRTSSLSTSWHGCPAQRTDVDYLKVPAARCGTLRRAAYSAAALLVVLLLYLPMVQVGFILAIVAASSLAEVLAPGARAGTLGGLVIEALIFSLVIFFGVALVGLLLTVAVSRVLNAFIKPDTVYPLYGFHDAAHRAIARIGRMRFFTYLFGDSAYIVHFLQWLGYRLSPVLQTGVNFGTEVR